MSWRRAVPVTSRSRLEIGETTTLNGPFRIRNSDLENWGYVVVTLSSVEITEGKYVNAYVSEWTPIREHWLHLGSACLLARAC